ncbi:MAG: hypothetical protein FWD97_01270 [Defluviitaleaceae bacterium]|nr:hypothetical protein [Defluviitaleaceae bacterium]
MLEKLEIIICLVAGLAVTVINIILGRDLTEVLLHLIISMAVFYILGLVVKKLLRKIFPPPVEEDEILSEYFLEDFDDTSEPIGEAVETSPAMTAQNDPITTNTEVR